MNQFTDRQIEIMDAATARIDKYGIQNLTIKRLAADIALSEPALYRHFGGKNDILLGVLNYFTSDMKSRLKSVSLESDQSPGDELKAIFNSQFQTFVDKPAVVSVIFAESTFHFDEALSDKVYEIMNLMHRYVRANVKRGQESGQYTSSIKASTLTTIIVGGMRLTVLKWKLSGHRSNLIKNGQEVLSGLLKMMVNKN